MSSEERATAPMPVPDASSPPAAAFAGGPAGESAGQSTGESTRTSGSHSAAVGGSRSVQPSTPVTLRGGDLPWRPISPKLFQVRLITLVATAIVPLGVLVALAVLLTPWVWIGAAVLLGALLYGVWLIRRQVSAITWIELPEEIVIRKGRILRSLVSVPYGRLQYVDVHSGPLMRAFGLASLQLHTASPASGGAISGLLIAEAEELRARLAARGETQRAGL